MAFAGGTETPIQMHFESGGSFQLVIGQLGNTLEKIVGDPHRTHGVRAGGPGADLVELLERGHDRTLGLLNYGEVG
jgi:hypothetical protein